MKTLKRIIALVCVVSLVMACAVDVFAAGSRKGTTYTVTFTVTTGNSNSTLKIDPSKGKVTATKWKNPFKGTTKRVTQSAYGDYTVTVSGLGSKRMTSRNVTFKLKKRTTYTVTVKYNGINFFDVSNCWNVSWKKAPSWKATSNNWAKVY
ncbi:MAG: hypothetical protein E7638_02580 [Ruminococcaceae bacterium]|nr:hypothetical protein [Oscillospiraceae bacterium]